jgi:hypothetical protein
MTPESIRGMADMAVAAGTVTREQADRWVTADLAEIQASTPVLSSSAPPGDAGVAQRALDLVRSGQMTQAQADAALAMYHAAPLPPDEKPQSKTPTPGQASPPAPSGAPLPWADVQLDPGFGPPAKPTDYRFEAMLAPALEADQLRGIGEIFHAAKMPPGIAHQIFSEVASMAAQQIDDQGMQLLNQRTMASLTALWGAQTGAKIETGRTFLRDLERARPGVLALLEESGAGSSAVVIRQVVAHAERVNAARRR